MLPKSNRLPHSVSFSNAKSVVTPYFRILMKGNELPYNRFGFVVSKKIDKRATVRNRLRRILQNAVANLAKNGNKDLLFIVKQSFINEKSSDIVSLIQSTLAKVL